MRIDDIIETTPPTRFFRVWKAQFRNTDLTYTDKIKDNAITGVIEQLIRNTRNGNQRTYRIAKDGTVFCLYWAFDCWCYDIVHERNYRIPSSCQLFAVTYAEALERMETHVSQYPG